MSALLAGAPVFGAAAKTAYVCARDVDYAGTAMFYGGLVFVSAIWPAGADVRAVRRLLVGAWLAGTAGTVAALGLEGAWVTQRSSTSAFEPSVLRQVLDSDFGREWAAKALLWLLASVVLADLLRRGNHAATALPWRVGAFAVGAGTLRINGLTGHSSDVHSDVTSLADFVHLAAISTWIGGLAVLVIGVLPRRDPDELQRVVPRFSRFALTSVSIAALSGTVLAWQLLDGAGQLTSTTWAICS